jgi:hypothetical protein
MCDFVSIALPEAASNAAKAWRRRGFALTEHENPTLRRALPAGYTPYLLTTGACSCDLCVRHPRAESTNRPDDAIALRDDAAAIVRELATADAPSLLYVHFYSGNVATEKLPVMARRRRALDSLSAVGDPVLRDELNELVPPKKPRKA